MKIRPSSLLVLVLALGAAGLSVDLRAAGSSVLAVSGRANANVSMASTGSFVAAVWAATLATGTTDIYASVSRDGGAAFTAPVRVNSTAGDARANGEQPPRVALTMRPGNAPEINVVWLAKRGMATVLLSARSIDGGRSFSASTLVSGTDAAGNRGWQSLAADSRGAVHAAWLDHRKLAERDTQMAAMHHHEAGQTASTVATKPAGVSMAELSQLYFATLGDDAARPVTGGVCYCCKTAMASGPGGEIYLAWRHVYAGNLRDIAFTMSRDAGKTFASPTRVSEDKWAIEGCPEDGPVLAVDGQARVHVVWPTVVSENGDSVKALFHAVSRDGRSFSERMRLPSKGQANHPQMIVAGESSLVVAWDESGNGARHIAVAKGKIGPDGRVSMERMTETPRIGTYPALAATSDGAALAWTTGDSASSGIRIESIK